MKRKVISVLARSCAIFMAIALATVSFSSCNGGDKDETVEYNEAYYFGNWFSEDGANYWFYEEGRGSFRSGGDVFGEFKYTVDVTSIHMHVTYWSETYHTIWKNDIEASYNPEKDILNIDGVPFYREGKVPKKDETQTEPVDTLAMTDTVAGK